MEGRLLRKEANHDSHSAMSLSEEVVRMRAGIYSALPMEKCGFRPPGIIGEEGLRQKAAGLLTGEGGGAGLRRGAV